MLTVRSPYILSVWKLNSYGVAKSRRQQFFKICNSCYKGRHQEVHSPFGRWLFTSLTYSLTFRYVPLFLLPQHWGRYLVCVFVANKAHKAQIQDIWVYVYFTLTMPHRIMSLIFSDQLLRVCCETRSPLIALGEMVGFNQKPARIRIGEVNTPYHTVRNLLQFNIILISCS